MIRTKSMIAAAAIVAGAAAGAAIAQERPKLDLGQAVASAEKSLGARAFDAELDMDRGVLVYEIDLVKDGRAVEAEVDAQSGALVRQNRQGVSLPWKDSDLKAAQTSPRSLFIYVKKANIGVTPGLAEFLTEFTSDAATGRGGYLQGRGLIPLPPAQHATQKATVANKTSMARPAS